MGPILTIELSSVFSFVQKNLSVIPIVTKAHFSSCMQLHLNSYLLAALWSKQLSLSCSELERISATASTVSNEAIKKTKSVLVTSALVCRFNNNLLN